MTIDLKTAKAKEKPQVEYVAARIDTTLKLELEAIIAKEKIKSMSVLIYLLLADFAKSYKAKKDEAS